MNREVTALSFWTYYWGESMQFLLIEGLGSSYRPRGVNIPVRGSQAQGSAIFAVKLCNTISTQICGCLLSLGRCLLFLLFYWQIWVTFPKLFLNIFFYLHLNFADCSYRGDLNIWRQLKVWRARIVTEFTRTHSVPPANSCIIFFDGGILLAETWEGRGSEEVVWVWKLW